MRDVIDIEVKDKEVIRMEIKIPSIMKLTKSDYDGYYRKKLFKYYKKVYELLKKGIRFPFSLSLSFLKYRLFIEHNGNFYYSYYDSNGMKIIVDENSVSVEQLKSRYEITLLTPSELEDMAIRGAYISITPTIYQYLLAPPLYKIEVGKLLIYLFRESYNLTEFIVFSRIVDKLRKKEIVIGPCIVIHVKDNLVLSFFPPRTIDKFMVEFYNALQKKIENYFVTNMDSMLLSGIIESFTKFINTTINLKEAYFTKEFIEKNINPYIDLMKKYCAYIKTIQLLN